MGVGGGWEAKGRLNHPLAVRKSHCVLSKAQKQLQCTCQDKTVVGNSLTPLVALLVHPSGTIHPAVDRHEFTWSDVACESRPGHPQPCHWSIWIVLECGFHVKL